MTGIAISELTLLRAVLMRLAEAVAVTTAGPPPDGGVIVYANAAFERLVGQEAARLVGRGIGEIGGESLPAAVSAALRTADEYRGCWREALEQGRPQALECRVRSLADDGSGAWYWLWTVGPDGAASVGPMAEGRRNGHHGLLRAVIEASDDLVTLSDGAGRFRLVNSAAAAVLGQRRAEDLLGCGHTELFAPADAAGMRAGDQHVLETGHRLTIEHTLDVAGRRRHFLTTRAPQRDAVGAVVGVISISRDITEFKETQERLLCNERLASIGTLAAGIAHEINNPVGGILLSAQAGVDELVHDKDQAFVERCLREIIEDAKRCGRIIQSLLHFARADLTEKWPGDLNDLVRRTLQLLGGMLRQHGATAELCLAADLPPVPLNRTEIEQVLINLVQNAVEMSGAGVRVVVRTERSEDGVRLSVADDGPGMLPEQAAYVFDPFYTTRQQRGGAGLGLSVVHGIVRGHGGRIDVASKLNKGTVFTIDLPC
ncbi:MAG: PAS domain-containing protein [Phycisphaerae bacterium]|jgi:PAS domain S-box-containing protein